MNLSGKSQASRSVLSTFDMRLVRAWKELHRLALIDTGWSPHPVETMVQLALVTEDDDHEMQVTHLKSFGDAVILNFNSERQRIPIQFEASMLQEESFG